METPKSRPDPINLLLESNKGRLPEQAPIRFGRMLQSPFAFFRGSACLMAADPSHTRNSGLKVQACGDAHLWNFGGFATPDRNVIFDTRSRAEVLRQLWEIMLGHASRACFFNSFQSTFSIASWGASMMKRLTSIRSYQTSSAFMNA